jgi:3-phenylpropionate/trans-cinnamate dioxygenase ferredoxin reductase subunit
MSQKIVIVGASLAGGTAAITLREEGFDGEILLIGAETHPPYERPPLSKEYLRGEKPLTEALVKPADYYSGHNIQTLFGTRALGVDPARKVVELENGEFASYDQLLIATGVRNRRLKIPGAELAGIYYLRDVSDADAIRKVAQAGSKAVMVGMGFIGSEIAASLRHLGVAVTVIEPFKTPLYRVLGEEIGRVFASIHADQGVEMWFEEGATAFEGTAKVERVVTSGGRKLDCDFVVVGVGVEPATEIVAGSGVKLENGIVVDQFCRTNLEGIYAVGDVANHYHPVFERHLRVEHWQNAIHQAQAAARNMLGKSEAYSDIHWFWSDQYNHNIQYAGAHNGWDKLVIRGSLEKRDFVGFFMRDEIITAAVALNRGKELRRAMSFIKDKLKLEPEKLADEQIDLRSLLPGARPVRTERPKITPRAV